MEADPENGFVTEAEEKRRKLVADIPSDQLSRKTIITTNKGKGQEPEYEEVDLTKELTRSQYEAVVQQALQTHEQDSQEYLEKVEARLDRVGLRRPSVEVRFQDLYVETEVYADLSRNLPSVIGFYRSAIEWVLQKAYILRPDKRKLVILDHMSGVLKPGRLTMLLGPPSSGKSTLLKALSGVLQNSSLKVEGSITYNGRSFEEFIPLRTAAYVDQSDIHIGEMTVRETFDFAARCQGAGTKKKVLEELRKREKEGGIEPDWSVDSFMKVEAQEANPTSIVTEYTIRMLGLGICSDTMVGDAMRRGISGGQKKRVTTGEMIVGPKRVLFMDEISTGLDSSTTYNIVKWLADQTHTQLNTTLISLLQPAPESYELFDDVLLIAEGHIVYHGPVGQAVAYFESLGFLCPERKGVADFLQEVTSKKDQQQYWCNSSQPYKVVTPADFAQRFQMSNLGQAATTRLETPFDTQAQQFDDAALVKEPFALTAKQAYLACWDREFILVKRNLGLYIFRFFNTMLVGLITAFSFFRTRLHPDSVAEGNSYFSVVFFSLIMIMFDGTTEIHLGVQRLPGFYKQRDNRFYPSWAFVLPTTVLRLPYSFLAATAWTCVVYYVTGLAPEASRFFYFLCILFMIHTMGIGMFRAIAGLARDDSIATVGGSFFFLILLMCGGFLLSKDKIPGWWIWFYWIDPLAYAQKGLAVNEFQAPRWKQVFVSGPGSQSVGDAVLGQRGLPTYDYERWLGIGVLVFAWIVFNLVTWVCYVYLSALEKPTAVLPPAMQEAIAEEMEAKKQGKHRSQKQLELAATSSKQLPVGALGPNTNGIASTPIQNIPAAQMSRTSHSMQPTESANLDKELAAVAAAKQGSGRKCSSRLGLSTVSQRVNQDGEAEVIDKGMVLPFQPLSLTFRNMDYYVPLPKAMDTTDPEKIGPKAVDFEGTKMLQLLNNCSGCFQPGILTALVGSSGAGKTTLMDCLAGRKTSGKITGDIRVSGHPKVQETFARVMGYCEQFDIHSPNTTVGEALWISSRLRFGNEVDNPTVRAFIAEVEDLVELDTLRGSLVGVPGKTGLSVEQRKRLTIAVELVANPSIVFMDEPTSGLDARAAAIVMRVVKNIVNTGRTIVCTIHQPSIDIFEAFDDLLLMKVGGQIIYHGPLGKNSIALIDYFEAIPGVPKLRDGLNPATWMLQISTPGMEKMIGLDFAAAYRESSTFRNLEATLDRLEVPAEGSQPLAFSSQFAQSKLVQFYQLLLRNLISYSRNPAYNGTRFIFGTVLGILFGSILWQIGTQRSNVQDLSNILGALYLAMLFLGFINSMSVQPVVAYERAVSYRETAAGMYSPLPFALAACAVEVPYILLQGLLFSAISYWMIGFEASAAKFWYYTLMVFLTLFLMTNYGIMSVYATPGLAIASVCSSMFFGIWNLTAGFIIPKNQMPPYFKWYINLNPIAWSLQGIISSQLGDVTTPLTLTAGQPSTTVKQYLDDTYDYKYSFLGWCILILIGYGIAFAFIAVLALRFLKYQKR